MLGWKYPLDVPRGFHLLVMTRVTLSPVVRGPKGPEVKVQYIRSRATPKGPFINYDLGVCK